MNDIVAYLLKTIACSGLFAAAYWLFMRNRLFHEWNRWYIVFSVPVSLILPLLRIPVGGVQTVAVWYHQAVKPAVTTPAPAWPTAETLAAAPASAPVDWLTAILSLVGVALLLRECILILRIMSLKRKATPMMYNGVKLLCTDDPAAPFSFFRNIFWRAAIAPDSAEGTLILRHELAHVRRGHSCDKALMQAACCLFWMNPFFHLFRRELCSLHEFAADHDSVGNSNGAGLSFLILNTLYPSYFNNLSDYTNRFFQSSIKRRIKMIHKIKKSKFAVWNKLSIVPVLAMALYLFAFDGQVVRAEIPASAPATESENSDSVKEKDRKTVTMPVDACVTIVAFADIEPEQKKPAPWPPIVQGLAIGISEDLPKGTFWLKDVDSPPLLKGSKMNKFREFLTLNIVYPAFTQKEGYSASFTGVLAINEKGEVSITSLECNEIGFNKVETSSQSESVNEKSTKSQINEHPINAFASEIRRVIKKMPKWTPAKKDGQTVTVRYPFAVSFKLEPKPATAAN